MKEHDDDVSGVYQQHSCHRRSIILPSSSVIWIFDSTFAELEFLSPISSVIKRYAKVHLLQFQNEKRSLNASKRSGQLSFPKYVSAFADENICQICKSASTTVSKRETFFECFKTQRARNYHHHGIFAGGVAPSIA
ncbi:hypothetical protein T06_10705 [Trichinella sp. T6]|nr:hypothetical protein T06_10705 [Trichinella sp. T6]